MSLMIPLYLFILLWTFSTVDCSLRVLEGEENNMWQHILILTVTYECLLCPYVFWWWVGRERCDHHHHHQHVPDDGVPLLAIYSSILYIFTLLSPYIPYNTTTFMNFPFSFFFHFLSFFWCRIFATNLTSPPPPPSSSASLMLLQHTTFLLISNSLLVQKHCVSRKSWKKMKQNEKKEKEGKSLFCFRLGYTFVFSFSHIHIIHKARFPGNWHSGHGAKKTRTTKENFGAKVIMNENLVQSVYSLTLFIGHITWVTSLYIFYT